MRPSQNDKHEHYWYRSKAERHANLDAECTLSIRRKHSSLNALNQDSFLSPQVILTEATSPRIIGPFDTRQK
jgi:hypothetical protein